MSLDHETKIDYLIKIIKSICEENEISKNDVVRQFINDLFDGNLLEYCGTLHLESYEKYCAVKLLKEIKEILLKNNTSEIEKPENDEEDDGLGTSMDFSRD